MITATSMASTSNSSSTSSPASLFLQATDDAYRTLHDELLASFDWDKSRTAKMAAWSFMFTPFYLGIFKMYGRYLPKKNLPSIAARVGFSFLASIPINFAFYTYGNFVEHTGDWYGERQEALQQQQYQHLQQYQYQHRQQQQKESTSTNTTPFQKTAVDVPYRFDLLVEKTQRKLEAELVNTIKTSATFWIPLNFLMFSVIPAHIQPVTLMFFSAFWNCYLSMSQHREVIVADDDDKSSQLPALD